MSTLTPTGRLPEGTNTVALNLYMPFEKSRISRGALRSARVPVPVRHDAAESALFVFLMTNTVHTDITHC